MTAFHIALPGGTSRTIGGAAPCFVIAEIGTNWCLGDRHDDRHARALIDVAAETGCDAVKFQTYTPETVYVPNPGESDYLSEAGIKRSILDVIGERVMPREMLPGLAAYAAEKGLAFMSSCFSVEDIGLIDPLTPVHKLASYEITHLRLVDALAATGKPLILSTGAAPVEDIDWVIERYRAQGGGALAVLQCTARYPAPDEAMNLRAIPWLVERYGVVAGLSDHSAHPFRAPFAAATLGAKVIEKHITLDRSLDGPDHFNSVLPDELAEMVAGIRAIEAMLGDGIKKVEPAEQELFTFARRGLQATRDIAAGEILREGDNFAILRPGKRRPGAHPRLLAAVEGRRARGAIACGDGIAPELAE